MVCFETFFLFHLVAVFLVFKKYPGTFVVVQCLRLLASTAGWGEGGMCSIPSRGTKIPYASIYK